MARPLIDPSLLESLGFLFNKTVTIQESTETRNGYGEPISTWANKSGHINIPCVASPAGGNEIKRSDMTYVVATHKILLQGHYPTISETMRAVLGGVYLDILLVEHDSQDLTTRLLCQIVR